MAFTEQEERFIEATIPVVVKGEEKRIAEEAFHQASDAAAKIAPETLGERRSDLEYVRDLTLEAARRAGFDDESPVVGAINEAYADVKAYVELMDRLNDAVLAEANAGEFSL